MPPVPSVPSSPGSRSTRSVQTSSSRTADGRVVISVASAKRVRCPPESVSTRRVGSIAIVHETLSQTVEEDVEFDVVAARLGSMVTEVSGVGVPVRVVRHGSFGTVPSEVATPLAMVLTELLQNAAEHGYAAPGDDAPEAPRVGTVDVRARRRHGRLHIEITDDGVGLPEGFDPDASGSLGLSIVRTLVDSELSGQLTMGSGPEGRGARVTLDLPIQ